MSNKQELIKEMLEMQAKFIAFEQKNGVHPDDYYNPGADHELSGYKQKYNAAHKPIVIVVLPDDLCAAEIYKGSGIFMHTQLGI